MRRGAVLAAFLLAGCASPLRRADRLLDKAERRVAAPALACTPEDAAKLLGDRSLPASFRNHLESEVRWDLERYYSCLSFARKDPTACDPLKKARLEIVREEGVPPVSFELLCKTVYYEALMAQDVIGKKGRIKELCKKRNLIGDRDFRLDSLDVSCGIIAEHTGDTAATCGRLGPYFDNASIAKTCPKMLRFVSGDETVCPLLPDPMVNERCKGYVALKKGQCGDSIFCRQANGAGEELCAPAGKAVADAACRALAAARPRVSPEPLFRQAEAAIERAEDSVDADARAERLARLRLRWESR